MYVLCCTTLCRMLFKNQNMFQLLFFHTVSCYTVVHLKDNGCCPMLRTMLRMWLQNFYTIFVLYYGQTYLCHIYKAVIKNWTSVHTCTLTILHLDGDHLGNFLYIISHGRKHNDHFLADKKLVDEINDLSDNRIL